MVVQTAVHIVYWLIVILPQVVSRDEAGWPG